MNTSTTIRSFFLVSLLLLLGNAYSWGDTPAIEKKKEVNQSYPVGSGDQLQVENIYGNITVVHWDRNEVAIRVVIEAKANNDSRAQELIDRVTIHMNKSGNAVLASTSLKSGNIQGNRNESLQINYFITMPAVLTTELSQKYGNIAMPDKNTGKCDIEIHYGNVKAGSFTAELNVDAKYSNVELKDLATVNMDIAYAGKVIIGNATMANIDSQYSNLEVKDVRTLNLETDYGNLKAGKLGKANLEMGYSNGDIEAVEEELLIGNLDYGTLNVKDLSSNFTRVSAEASYGNLNLTIPGNTAFNVVAENMKYGSVSIEHNAQTRKEGNTIYSTVNNGSNKKITFDGNSYSNLKIRTR